MQSNSLTRLTDLCNQKVPSSITHHLLVNVICINAYNLNIFTILKVSKNELQLSVLEVLSITKYQPTLCKQKEFFFCLTLPIILQLNLT